MCKPWWLWSSIRRSRWSMWRTLWRWIAQRWRVECECCLGDAEFLENDGWEHGGGARYCVGSWWCNFDLDCGVRGARGRLMRRERRSCRKALVKVDESVMFMTIEKNRHQPHANTIMLALVDRSDEVVVGMIDRAVKARMVFRVQKSSEMVPEMCGQIHLTRHSFSCRIRMTRTHIMTWECVCAYHSILIVIHVCGCFCVCSLCVSRLVPFRVSLHSLRNTSWHTRSKWNFSTNRTKKTTFETIWPIKLWTSVNTDCVDQTYCTTLLRRSEC